MKSDVARSHDEGCAETVKAIQAFTINTTEPIDPDENLSEYSEYCYRVFAFTAYNLISPCKTE